MTEIQAGDHVRFTAARIPSHYPEGGTGVVLDRDGDTLDEDGDYHIQLDVPWDQWTQVYAHHTVVTRLEEVVDEPQGVWVTFRTLEDHYDIPVVTAVFDDELQALRFANSEGYRAKFLAYGEEFPYDA